MSLQSYAFTSASSANHISQTWVNGTKNVFVIISLNGTKAQQDWEKIRQQLQSKIHSPQDLIAVFTTVSKDFQSASPQLAGLFVQNDSSVVAAVFDAKIWLKRNGKVGTLVQSRSELQVVQGKLHDEDTVVLGSRSAYQSLDTFLSQQLQQHDEAESVIPLVMTELQKHKAKDAVGLVVAGNGNNSSASSPPEKVVKSKPTAINTSSFSQVKKMLHTVRRKSGFSWHSKLGTYLKVGIAIALLIIAMMIGLSVWRGFQVRRAEAFIAPFESQLQDIQQLADSDQLAARDQALQLLNEWKSAEDEYNPSASARSVTDSFGTQVQDLYNTLSGRTSLAVLPVYYDFRLVRSDFIASYADVDGNVAMFLDPAKSALIQLNLDNKQQLILPIGEYQSLTDLSYSNELVYLLSDGLYRFPIDSKANAVKIVNEDDQNRKGQYLGIFENYLYVFNPEERNIYRYNIADSGEVDEASDEGDEVSAIGWIQDKKDLEFADITSMAIDGSIWLGTSKGEILVYERGAPVDFSPVGLETEFSGQLKIFTKPDYENIYVLEPEQQRVVVLRKDGTYVQEFVSEKLEAGSEIIAREDSQRIYVVAGSLLYELEM